MAEDGTEIIRHITAVSAVYQAHSFRGAGLSHALQKGASISDIPNQRW